MEKDWEAEDDAHTLAKAEKIKADKTRMAKAKKAAAEMASESEAKTKALKKIAAKPLKMANPVKKGKKK